MELFKSRTRVTYTNAVGDKVYPVVVDIKKGIKATEDIQFVSSDVNTGILSVAFIQGNDTYNVAGAEVVCSIMRPDASTLDIPCTVIENNIVEVPLGVNGTSQDGVYSFDFKVFKGGNKVVGTPIMNYSVSLSISNDNAVLEDDRLPVLTMLMTQLTDLKGEARETINQANAATVSSREATANAIAATNNANATINTANQKMLEVDNAKNEMTDTVNNKINDVETRFNRLTSSQQQDAEVIDARTDFKGEVFDSLKDRIDYTDKLLRDSTVSTVETESDFTTVEATSNGYFEDVKLEGKTLVNLPRRQVSYYPSGSNGAIIVSDSNVTCYEYEIKPNTTYTIKKDEVSDRGTVALFSSNSVGSVATKAVISMISDGKISTIRTGNEDKYMLLYVNSTLISSGVKTTVLEGDHTQNPPSGYIEGLKSVGEDVDEIVVSSVKGDGNLFDGRLDAVTILTDGNNLGKLVEHDSVNSEYTSHIKPIPIQPNTTYEVGIDNSDLQALCMLYDNNMNPLCFEYSANGIKQFTTPNNAKYARVRYQIKYSDINNYNMYLVKIGDTSKDYMLHQSDKKRLLYYNEETQTWEKPILREWDSIEKHSNGKYYYHQRSGEEGYTKGDESVSDYITDMTTTVKPLAQEKVYECTNIDLITYANETNYIVESGAIAPKSILKVHNNISNVVKILQEKVSLLESNVKASQEVQDMMILETDMRMLDIELALMEFMPMTLNLGGSSMLRSATYFNFVKNHIVNETYEKEYLENVMNKYLATGRINQDEYDELYKMLYPPVYDIELPIEL